MGQHLNDVKKLVTKGIKSDSFASHSANHCKKEAKPTSDELRKMMKVKIIWQGNAISCMKSIGKLNCSLCMRARSAHSIYGTQILLSANFLVLIISHINMMLIVMLEHPRRLHNGDYSQNKKLLKILSLQDFAQHKIVKFHEITTYYLTTCVP
jgi:hypothetical protein